MFDEEYKKFVKSLQKPASQMLAEITPEENRLFNFIELFNIFGANMIAGSSDFFRRHNDENIKSYFILKENHIPFEDSLENKAQRCHMTIGFIGEVGEIIDSLKKSIFYRKTLDLVNIVEEIGDMCFYTCGYIETIDIPYARNMITQDFHKVMKIFVYYLNEAFGCNITLDECIRKNKEKLSIRYAKGSYSDKQAVERADKVEL